MKTIEELAIEHNILGAISPDRHKILDAIPTLKDAREQALKKLEAFVKAYMQDRLESLELLGYTSQGYIDGVKNSIGDLGNFAGNFFKNKWRNVNIPLYDISTLKDKP